MPGPTAWQQSFWSVVSSVQTIVTNTETVICTLPNITSRQVGAPIFFDGGAAFAVNATTTGTTLRIRQDSLTGTVVGVGQAFAETAGTIGSLLVPVTGQDLITGEVNARTYVLTIQSAAAGANWNVALASLQAVL